MFGSYGNADIKYSLFSPQMGQGSGKIAALLLAAPQTIGFVSSCVMALSASLMKVTNLSK